MSVARWVIVAWVAAGLLSLAGALTYAELTAMKPEAAGPYVFCEIRMDRFRVSCSAGCRVLLREPVRRPASRSYLRSP